MEIFDQIESMGHERVLFCSNPDVGLKAIIAVHSTVLGPGLGGVRMWNYETSDQAVTDVLRLSRGLTYKAAAAGLNLGGGKAVIIGDAKRDKSEALFRCFGTFVESLGGLYITAEDVGTTLEDMDFIHMETKWVTGVSPSFGGAGDPSPVTAFGVHQGMKAAALARYGDASLRGKAVAIQGLGSVGYYLASYLKAEGAKLFGCDIDPARIDKARGELGLEAVGTDEIYDVPCDVFAPCALGATLNADTIPRLRAPIVAGGANNQLKDPDADGPALHARGILYAPDFVGNAGGLINVYNELLGYNKDRAMGMARGIFHNMARVFEISAADSIPSYQAADRMAEERIQKIRQMRPVYWDRTIRRERKN